MALFHHDDCADQNLNVAKWAASRMPVIGQCLAVSICIALAPLVLLTLPFVLFSRQAVKSGEYWD